MFRCIILDFDGTLTDVDQHVELFYPRVKSELAQRLGLGLEELSGLWRREEQKLREAPAELGWLDRGQWVAPAHGDPYLIANSIVKALLQQTQPELDDRELARGVFDVHRLCYHASPPAFRPDVAPGLDLLLEKGWPVFVVTNSHPAAVGARLDSLGLRHRNKLTVHGDAQKLSIRPSELASPRFDALPESLELTGFGRPLLLHRGRYFDVLEKIWQTLGCGPEQTLVCGDLFELDLAMPWSLGAHIHLLTRKGTLAHEKRAAERPRGGLGADFTSVLKRLGI